MSEKASQTLFFAYSSLHENIVQEIHTRVGLLFPSDRFDEISADDLDVHWINALWDTGATNSCISRELAQKMNLEAVAIASMETASEVVEVPVYSAHLFLPKFPLFAFLRLPEFQNNSDGCDIIIGMDLITQGDFAISSFQGKTLFSFRMPSLQAIDFEAELRKLMDE